MRLIRKSVPLIICSIFYASLSFAQDSGWEAGVTVAGGASDVIITRVQNTLFAKEFADNARRNIKPKFYYSAGIYGRKFFNDMYGVEVGVQYASFSVGAARNKHYDINGNYVGYSTLAVRYNYVEIPVRFVFKKELNSNFAVGAYAGVSPAFLTHGYQRSVTKINGNRDVSKDNINDNLRKLNLFIDVGALFRYNISEHLAIDAKPFFRISPIDTYTTSANPYYQALLVTGGLNVNTVWKF